MDCWAWEFLGFESTGEGQPVQRWYDALPQRHADEVVDLLLYLGRLTDRAWQRPEFDRLDGAGGIGEIRAPVIRDAKGVSCYRIYGYFGPERRQYTFLHAVNKKVKNDRKGKAVARRRLEEIGSGHAAVHKFSFERHSMVETDERKRGEA